jgi:hypothetical protein
MMLSRIFKTIVSGHECRWSWNADHVLPGLAPESLCEMDGHKYALHAGGSYDSVANPPVLLG